MKIKIKSNKINKNKKEYSLLCLEDKIKKIKRKIMLLKLIQEINSQDTGVINIMHTYNMMRKEMRFHLKKKQFNFPQLFKMFKRNKKNNLNKFNNRFKKILIIHL